MRRSILKFALLWSAVAVQLWSCSDPPKPAPPTNAAPTPTTTTATDQSAGTSGLPSAASTSSGSGTSSATTYGAAVGTSSMQLKVSDCNAAGFFFDRKASPPACSTTRKVASFACTKDSIKAIPGIDEALQKQITDATDPFIADGFLVDQCLAGEEATAPANPNCPSKYTIYLAKDDHSPSGAAIIALKSTSFPGPTCP